ncbi:MAG: 16S rRNA (cytosine(1402)-N(4))-methyltransferase RsmH [Opitutaceae bacterium]|nr:16S rRNA (cytosine(1402)-N(4))-methyltransferase RsmH [Cytophagales bacterium]
MNEIESTNTERNTDSKRAYHNPVMLNECIEGLNLQEGGIYIDVTFGGGGHTKAILQKLAGKGKLYGFDQDPDAKVNAEAITDKAFTFVEANFRDMQKYMRLHGIDKVDGILADLGVSSHQFDTAERGFSIRFDAPLDMRMRPQGELTAAKILKEYHADELHKIFGMYGEVKNAKTLASQIVRDRVRSNMETVDDFKKSLSKLAPKGAENKYFAQAFQALRIEVNQELEALQEFLEQAVLMLKPGGRLVVMSYHSLEDRLVKNYIQKGKFGGDEEKDFYGNVIKPFEAINKKPIEAGQAELERNNRSRSAKLRIAERLVNS